MRPIVVFSSVVVSAVVTALATALVLSAMAGAQASQVQAQSVTIVSADGKPVLRLSATPLGTGQVQVLAADGSVRVAAQTGGRPEFPDPLGAGLNVFYAGSVGNSLAARMGQETGNPEFQLLGQVAQHPLQSRCWRRIWVEPGHVVLAALIEDGVDGRRSAVE